MEISAVLAPVSKSRASIMFVDNRARAVYGQLHVDDYDGGHFVDRFIEDVLASMRTPYQQRLETSFRQKKTFPSRQTSRLRCEASSAQESKNARRIP